MFCDRVSKQLSGYFDGELDTSTHIKISRHLKQCARCWAELGALAILHDRLASVPRVQAPDYLYRLVRMRLEGGEHRPRADRLRDAWALQWSRFRTTGFLFYWTRALGTVMAAFFFCVISSGIDPFYGTGSVSPVSGQAMISREYSEQVRSTIMKNFGRFPIEQYSNSHRHVPAINDQYFNLYWNSVPETTNEEDLAVVLTIEPSGTVKIENVLKYPEDRTLLHNLNDLCTSARGRPASMNGRSVSSPMVLNLNWITVSTPPQ